MGRGRGAYLGPLYNGDFLWQNSLFCEAEKKATQRVKDAGAALAAGDTVELLYFLPWKPECVISKQGIGERQWAIISRD